MSGVEYRRFSINMAVSTMEHHHLQGWLTVASCIEAECLDQLDWHRRYCVLAKDERRLYFYDDTESLLLSSSIAPVRISYGGDEAQDGQCLSTRKNALTLLDPNYSSLSSTSQSFQRGTRQTRSFKDKVRSSLQKSVKKNSRDDRLGGGSVRVSRSKSFGKMDKLIDPSTSSVPGYKLGSSLESLHHVGSGGGAEGGDYYSNLGDHGTTLDLATKGLLNISPVHQSISPRHSCFRVITETDVLYASCGSQEELDKWLTSLIDCQRPNRNHLTRLDSQLSLWVLEARHLQPKKRYYCEISLNGVLYARTCCKMMNDILFWGEPFIFEDLPLLGSVLIKLYRENYNKKKKERSDTDLGKIEIPTLVLENGQLHEKWYQLTTYNSTTKNTSSTKLNEAPSIRIKLHYKMVSILPLKTYEEFLQHLKTDYGTMCEVLEPLIPTKAKDEIAQTLVRILEVEGKVKEFLCDIIMTEVQLVENENLIFRGNTFATKAVDTYMKMVGQTYLHSTLNSFVHTLMSRYASEDCEVDPMKISTPASLTQNQACLTSLVKTAWGDILMSFNKFPTDLRVTLNSIRQRFGPDREEACFKLISGSIFLRFFCPAILSPSLFSLCQEYPNEKIARKLTLVAKVIQNLANFTRFGVKEEYMCFMNDFLSKEVKNMKQFINKISSPHVGDQVVPWGPQVIDIAREASIMHISLSNLLASLELPELASRRIEKLTQLLHNIHLATEEETSDPFTSTFEALRVMKNTISKFNVLTVDQETSPPSSEYTTPAQSQTTSPTRETSPPSFVASEPSLNNLMSLGLSKETSVSPSSSPTQGGVSSLATHSMVARRLKTQTLPNSSRVASLGEVSSDPRRLSDSVLQRGVQQLKAASEGHLRSPPIVPSEAREMSIDEHIAAVELRLENVRLLESIEKLKLHRTAQSDSYEREKEALRKECSQAEDLKRKAEHELKTLRDSRGKILRGLNTQTEIALVQLKRDFESMRKQLLAKDEIITFQERRITSLIEANSTLRSGLQDLVSLPRMEDSDSDDAEGTSPNFGSKGQGRGRRGRGGYAMPLSPVTQGAEGRGTRGAGTINGHPGSPRKDDDLFRIISQLDSGKFEPF